jgi:hypothetical protein
VTLLRAGRSGVRRAGLRPSLFGARPFGPRFSALRPFGPRFSALRPFGPRFSGVLVCAAALAGCGGVGGTSDGPTMRVDTLNGVVHVQHAGRAPVGRLVRTLTLGEAGGLDEASPAEFGRVRTVISDEDGRLYVADAQALEIRVFEADGRFVGALGRKGGGPGEMEGLHGTAWLTPDTMVVADYGNARLGLMDRHGRHLGQWPWMRITGPVRFFFAVRPGEIWARGFRSPGEAGSDRVGMEPVWVRYGVDGPADALTIPRLDAPLPGTSATCRGDGIGFFTNPYGERLLAAPAPGGERVVAMTSTYRIAFLDPAGDTVRVLARDPDPVPLSDEDWRETEEQYAEFRQQWRGAACDGEIRRPRHVPTLREVSFDHDGRLLVELTTPAGPALDIYDPDGRWLTTLPLPERDSAVPLFLRDDRLHLVTRDSLGVQRVEVYEVRHS